MTRSRTSRFIVGLLTGTLRGFAATVALPDEVFIRLHRDWGIGGLMDREAIAILLLGIP